MDFFSGFNNRICSFLDGSIWKGGYAVCRKDGDRDQYSAPSGSKAYDQKELLVFGDDYPTKDGTGVRDYIHVQDLAAGHLAALQYLEREPGLVAVNLGTGRGYSVFEMIEAFEKATGKKVPYRVVARRPGDIATCYCDPGKAERELGWKAQYGIKEMCADSWRWQKNNPNGYED